MQKASKIKIFVYKRGIFWFITYNCFTWVNIDIIIIFLHYITVLFSEITIVSRYNLRDYEICNSPYTLYVKS